MSKTERALDPVTFEVLKNAFATSVDLMSEQILRTCHSFVIYARDFSCSLCDASGDTIMQGVAGHRRPRRHAALHLQGRHRRVRRRHQRGRRVRRQRPVPAAARTSTTCASSGRSSTTAGSSPTPRRTGTGPTSAASVPGSFDINAKEHFGEGLRIPPVRLWDRGRLPARRRPADLLEHPHADRLRGRHARAGRGDAGLRAGDPAARRPLRRRDGRDGVRRGAELRRASHAGRASRRCPTSSRRRSTTSTSTRPAARA